MSWFDLQKCCSSTAFLFAVSVGSATIIIHLNIYLSTEIQKWNWDVMMQKWLKSYLFVKTTVVGKTPKVLLLCLIKCFLNMLSELISLLSSHVLLLASSVWTVSWPLETFSRCVSRDVGDGIISLTSDKELLPVISWSATVLTKSFCRAWC